jgi:hypothetical protein
MPVIIWTETTEIWKSSANNKGHVECTVILYYVWIWRSIIWYSGLEGRGYGRGDPSRWPRGTLYPQNLALTSPTSGGRSVGILLEDSGHGGFFYLVLDTNVLEKHLPKYTASYCGRQESWYGLVKPEALIVHNLKLRVMYVYLDTNVNSSHVAWYRSSAPTLFTYFTVSWGWLSSQVS